MRYERWLLPGEKVDQAAQLGGGVVGARVRGLAEEVGREAVVRSRPLQLIDDAAEQHGLALAGVAPDPEQAVLPVAPSLKVRVVQYPAAQVRQQASFGLHDAFLVEAGIGG